MAKKVGSVYAEIRAKLDKLEKDMSKAHGIAVSGTRKIQRTYDTLNFRRATQNLVAFQRTLMGIFAGVAAGRGIGGLIKAASDLEEVSNKFEVVFRGSHEKAAAAVQMLNDSYAMSRREAMQYMASVQDILVPLGFAREKAADLSTEIVKLSADLGSFNNVPTAQVMGDIQSALVGNYETMKKYGVVLNDTIAKDRAVALGFAKTREEVSYAEKAYAAFTLMVDSSKDAIGDMNRTLDSAANQWKQFQGNLEDFAGTLGNLILPALNAVLTEINDSLKQIDMLINSPQAKFARMGSRYIELQRERQEVLMTLSAAEKGVGGKYLHFNRGAIDTAKTRLDEIERELKAIEAKADVLYPKAVGSATNSKVGEINKITFTKDDFAKSADAVTEATKKAQAELKKLTDEITKLEQEFKDSIIFGGEDSAYERMQAQIRSGSQIAQMEADRAKYVSEQWDEAFNKENDRLSSRVAAWEQANRDIIDAEKRQQEILKDTADVMTQNFSDAFAEFVTGSKNAKEAFEDMVQSIISGMVRMASQRMFEQIFGMALKGFGSYSASQLPINQPGFPGAGTFHSGGVVGASGGPTRSIPAAAFSFAPRLHGGLMGDEYPAILQKGETVIPRGGAGGVTNNYYLIQAMDVRSFADYLRRSGAVPAIVSEDIRGNGITRKTMRGKW